MENTVKTTTTSNTTSANATTPVKVLWFSRHTMTEDQYQALETKLGLIEVTQLDKTINTGYDIADEIGASDVVALVAPIHIQQQVLKIAGDKPVIMALSERVLIPDPDGGESKAEFVFRKWERLIKIDVVKEDF